MLQIGGLMKILIVEDDQYKMRDIHNFVKKLYPKAVVDSAADYADALIKAYDIKYDFLVLDMNIPKYNRSDNDKSIVELGGEMIVRELISEDILIKFCIVTQYETLAGQSIEDIDLRIADFCPELYCGYVAYAGNDESWKDNFEMILKNNLTC